MLIDRSKTRGYRPGIVIIDAGYGNNTSFLKELEKRQLKYLVRLAKNRKVIIKKESGIESEIRPYELASSLSEGEFEPVTLKLKNPKTVWVATFSARVSRLEGERTFAIVMNTNSFAQATDIDYFITNRERARSRTLL